MHGRPKKYAFSGLFLPDVQWELAMQGHEGFFRKMEEDPTIGTLLTNLRRKRSNPNPQKLRSTLEKYNEKIKIFTQSKQPFKQFISALNGNESARNELEKLGYWETFALAQRDDPIIPFLEYTRIEKACKRADDFLHSSDFQKLADEIHSNPEISIFWSHRNIDLISGAIAEDQTLSSRLAAFLQLQVYILAKQSLAPNVVEIQDRCGSLENLLKSPQPGATLFKILLASTNLNSRQFLDRIATVGDRVDTVENWMKGKNFPPLNKRNHKLIFDSIPEIIHEGMDRKFPMEQLQNACETLYFIARRLNEIHFLIAKIQEKSQSACDFFLDHKSASEWLLDSYRTHLGRITAANDSDPAPARA